MTLAYVEHGSANLPPHIEDLLADDWSHQIGVANVHFELIKVLEELLDYGLENELAFGAIAKIACEI